MLHISDQGLCLAGHALAPLARQHGTPLYVYAPSVVRERLHLLRDALCEAAGKGRVTYAMKANRHPSILAAVRSVGFAGLDCCSPREVALALESGFRPDEISFNAGMLSNRDLEAVIEAGVPVILDSLSALRRYADRAPRGATVGLRFDPGVAASYAGDPRMAYGRAKFGFDLDQFEAIVAGAAGLGLGVDTVHVHLGWGLQADAEPALDRAFAHIAAVADALPDVHTINVGGGLTVPYVPSDRPLPLVSWREAIRRHLAPLGRTVACESGTFLVASAGVLLVEVNTVEPRRGATWVGVDAGFAVNPNAAHYGIALDILKVADPAAPPTVRTNVAGHLNEAVDVWARDRMLPVFTEGELLAFAPAGAYGAAMASDHCLRGRFTEVALPDSGT